MGTKVQLRRPHGPFRDAGGGEYRRRSHAAPSYLPELRAYLDTLLRDRERLAAATELDD